MHRPLHPYPTYPPTGPTPQPIWPGPTGPIPEPIWPGPIGPTDPWRQPQPIYFQA